MRRIAMISVTLNAVTPMMARFAAAPGSWSVTNYLDEGLQAKIAAEGGVRDGSMGRMGELLGKAAEGGAQAVLLTCTVFSPHLPALRQLYKTPMIGADLAMLERAAKLGRKTTILCTFPASIETSRSMFHAALKGRENAQPDVVLVEGAMQAMAAGQRERHDALVADAIRLHGQRSEVIVLAQMSMAAAAALVPDCPAEILTSPSCAIDALSQLFC